jgi:hypothetical protein
MTMTMMVTSRWKSKTTIWTPKPAPDTDSSAKEEPWLDGIYMQYWEFPGQRIQRRSKRPTAPWLAGTIRIATKKMMRLHDDSVRSQRHTKP